MKLYYVYELFYPDGTAFYVGKGCGKRMYQHEKDAAKGVISHKCKVIRNIWRSGGTVGKRIVFSTPSEADALLYEWVLINLVYGIDTLTNDEDDNTIGLRHPLTCTTREVKPKNPVGRPRKPTQEHKKPTEIPKWTHGRTWVFTGPDGTRYEHRGSLKQFCSQHGLALTSVHDLTTGGAATHKGWRVA